MMGKWYTEEVAGDIYIYDSDAPHAFGQPQGPPIVSFDGDYTTDPGRVIAAHNADIDRLEAERDALTKRINPEGVPVDIADLCVEIDRVTDDRDALQAKLDAAEAIITRLREVVPQEYDNRRFCANCKRLTDACYDPLDEKADDVCAVCDHPVYDFDDDDIYHDTVRDILYPRGEVRSDE